MAQRRPAARAAASPGSESSITTQRLGRELQRRARPVVALRIGLAGAHVLRGDDLGEVRPQAGELEHQLDLAPERARYDRRAESRRAPRPR